MSRVTEVTACGNQQQKKTGAAEKHAFNLGLGLLEK